LFIRNAHLEETSSDLRASLKKISQALGADLANVSAEGSGGEEVVTELHMAKLLEVDLCVRVIVFIYIHICIYIYTYVCTDVKMYMI
jgi:hypothetical protein